MDINLEFFLFALMVFGMVLVVLYMVLRSRQQRAEEGSATDEEWAKKEEKLMMLYFEVDDMIAGLKEYVENARQVTELEYGRVEALMKGAQAAPAQQPAASTSSMIDVTTPDEPLPIGPDEPDRPVAQELDRRERYEMAAQLLREQMPPQRIAEELHLSSSEIAILQKLAQS